MECPPNHPNETHRRRPQKTVASLPKNDPWPSTVPRSERITQNGRWHHPI